MFVRRVGSRLGVLTLVLITAACNFSKGTPTVEVEAPQDAPPVQPVVVEDTPQPTVEHITFPTDPPTSKMSEINDKDSSLFAPEKRTNGGENYNQNLFERPFNANTMDTYYPDLDILHTFLGMDNQWVYVTIRLVGTGTGGTLTGNYGVEIDRDVDGRGDVLVFASQVGTDWSTEGVRIWMDDNGDVGGNYPANSDAPWIGDGYENMIFDLLS